LTASNKTYSDQIELKFNVENPSQADNLLITQSVNRNFLAQLNTATRSYPVSGLACGYTQAYTVCCRKGTSGFGYGCASARGYTSDCPTPTPTNTPTPTQTPTPTSVPPQFSCEAAIKAADGGEILPGRPVILDCFLRPENPKARYKHEVIKDGQPVQTLPCSQNSCTYTIPEGGYGCYAFRCEVLNIP